MPSSGHSGAEPTTRADRRRQRDGRGAACWERRSLLHLIRSQPYLTANAHGARQERNTQREPTGAGNRFLFKRHVAPKSTAGDVGGPRGYPRCAAPAALRTVPDSSAHAAPPPSPSARPRLPPCPVSRRLPEPHTYRSQGRREDRRSRQERQPRAQSTTLTAPGRAGARRAAPQLGTPARLRGDEPERGRGRDRRCGLTAASANGKITFAFLLLPARGVITARPLRARVFP